MWGAPCVSKVPRVHSKYKALMLCEVREIETRYLIKLFCTSIESGLFFLKVGVGVIGRRKRGKIIRYIRSEVITLYRNPQ